MRYFLFILLFFFNIVAKAQESPVVKQPVDSLLPGLTIVPVPGASVIPVVAFDSCYRAVLQQSKLNLFASPLFQIEKEKQLQQREWLFYYLLALALLFGLLRLSYLRYFNDMFRVFFRTSLRVNQIREQLVQSGLQSLLFNLFFALAAGTYVYLFIDYFDISIKVAELFIPLISAGVIALLYLGKYIFLLFSGWLFSLKPAAETYSFVVFLINKIIGIILLPFLFVIAFAGRGLAGVAITVSLSIITALFLYRFLRAYGPVQSEIKVGRFHFFIFFLAFEIAPLLLIYKVIIGFL